MSVDVEAVRRSIDIGEFIARYVELRKEGGELAGCCPFHADTNPSLKVNPNKQVWACFACGQHEQHGADVFGFLMSMENCTFPEALEKLSNGHALPDAKPIKRPALKKPTRTLLVPPEDSKPEFARRDFGSPIKVWTICTLAGQPWFYEARYQVEGEKHTRFYTYGRYGEADPPRWECKHPPNPRPFYGLEQLVDAKRQVMIHEAPKKAEAARALWPALAHLGMLGGAQQVANMDLEPLRGRRLVLLPDNDEAGRQAMERLAARVLGIATEIWRINPDSQPDGSPTPEGWDVADSTDWTPKIALEWAKKRKTVYGAAQQVSVSARTEQAPIGTPDGRPAQPVAAAPPEIAQDAPDRAESVPLATPPESTDKPPIAQGVHTKGNGQAGPIVTPEMRIQAREAEARKAVLAGMNFRRVSEVGIKPIRWLWPGRIPLGKVSLIVGDPGLGKSQICASLAAVLTRGGLWPVSRESCPVGSVLLLSAEDDIEDTIRPRLEAANADVERVTVLRSVMGQNDDGTSSERGFSLATDLARMAVLVDSLADARLVIIDPVSAYLGQTDSHKNAEVRGLLAPLSQFAADRKLAVILVSHLTKSQSTNALQRVQGSIAFAAMARAVWGVAKDQENGARRLFVPLKNNLAQDTTGLAYSIESMQLEGRAEHEDAILTSRIMWEAEEVTTSAEEAFGSALTHEERGTVDDAKEFLRETLADGPVKSSAVQRAGAAAGHARTALFKAKKILHVAAKREGGLGKLGTWYWSMPTAPEIPDEPDTWVPD